MSRSDASTAAVRALERLDTASVSDALDRLGVAGQPVGIRPIDRTARVCGPAYTVRYTPLDVTDPGTVGDFVDDVPPGAVIVIDNHGRIDVTVWGDLMTTVAARNLVAGTVIHGANRDTARALELGYPLFSRSTFMRTGKDRVQLAAIGEPVSLGEHVVRAGDVVVGDADGVVVVPARRAEEVAALAAEIDEAEAAIRRRLAGGERLVDARRTHGYHQLQRRSS